jgi:hypothetical protein
VGGALVTYDIVHHPDQEELAIDEALRRLVTSFPRIRVDRPRGIALRRTWGSNCGSFTKIDPAKYSNPNQEIRAAWVSIDVEGSTEPVEFVLEDKMEFFFKHSSEKCRQLRRPATQKIADALGYAVSEWPLFLGVEITYGDEPFNGGLLIPQGFTLDWKLSLNSRLDEALSKQHLYAEGGFIFRSGYVRTTVIVDDDEIGKRRIEEAILSVLPDAILEFDFQPNDLPRCP